MRRQASTLLTIAIAAAVVSTAGASEGDFYYDATDANYMSYAGSVAGGSLSFESIPGRTFRVQRVGWGPDYTQIAYYSSSDVSLALAADMVSFHSANNGGPNDYALFAGVGALRDHDLIIADTLGNELTARISIMELIDRTSAWVQPHLSGAALLHDISFTSSAFESVSVRDLGATGIMTFSALTKSGMTMRDYLDGDVAEPLLLGTLEIKLTAIPAPGGLALLGLGSVVGTRRRRR